MLTIKISYVKIPKCDRSDPPCTLLLRATNINIVWSDMNGSYRSIF